MHPVDVAAVEAVLTASQSLMAVATRSLGAVATRSLGAVATRSLGAVAEDTTIAQYRALVRLASQRAAADGGPGHGAGRGAVHGRADA